MVSSSPNSSSMSPSIPRFPVGMRSSIRPACPVLIVDDDPTNREVVARLLEQRGYQVVQAAGGQEAVLSLTTGQFAAVLLDLWMPDLDGFGVLTALRTLPPEHRPPVIVVSASDDLDHIAR